MLALSFWEVHTARRCLAWWQQLSAAAAQASNQHRKQWLLLCSFEWWRRMTRHYQRCGAAGLSVMGCRLAEASTCVRLVHCCSLHSDSGRVHSAPDGLRVLCFCACRQQHPGAVEPLQQHLHEASRPSSPLTGLTRLLQQHPNLRPPCSPAAEMRQQVCGRMLATYAFAAWFGVAQQKAQQRQLQQQLTWHHVQHVQAGVWNKWRAEFELRSPKHKLMRAVYRARRYSTMRKVGGAVPSVPASL
jgi:hypothetical protein